ncbi:MAG: hypothetical protein ACRC46_00335, partial [Thermoguttaceae bacterium]
YILERLRSRSSASINHRPILGNVVGDLCVKAGVSPWTKPFVSMRASCATDLAERFPLQATTAWLGHSVAIANKHYLRVRAEYIARAIEEGIGGTSSHQKTGAVGAKNGAIVEKMDSISDKEKTATQENTTLAPMPRTVEQDQKGPHVPTGQQELSRG